MADTETVDLQAANLLDEDNVPNANQAHHCLSCERVFTGIYCKHCGQKNDNYRRSLVSLLLELGVTLTALEGRIWRTWAALIFKPGKVAREYANGARTKWSSPVRTYLAMSLILFGFMRVTQTHIFSFDLDVQPKAGVTKPKTALKADDLSFELQFHIFERQSEIDKRNIDRDFDLIKIKLLGADTLDQADLQNAQDSAAQELQNSHDIQSPPAGSDNTEDLGLTVDEEGSIYINGTTIGKDQMSLFLIDFIQNPSTVTNSFRVWLPRLMFFMMPLTMLIGAMFIRGRENAMLYDHIIHAAYIHSVAYFLIFIGILATYVGPNSIIASAVFWSLLVYLPLSLRRMFKRGWIKTIWTSYGVGAIYAFILFLGMAIILVNTLRIAAQTAA